MRLRRWRTAPAWLVYPVALVVGVVVGLIAHSGIVASAVALALAVTWKGIGQSR